MNLRATPNRSCNVTNKPPDHRPKTYFYAYACLQNILPTPRQPPIRCPHDPKQNSAEPTVSSFPFMVALMANSKTSDVIITDTRKPPLCKVQLTP